MQGNPSIIFKKLIPPIRVHVWGGFGSQIFALLICRRLLKLYPFRRIKIVFHSSGVTERLSELPSRFLQDFTSIQKRDYRVQNIQMTSLNSVGSSTTLSTIVKKTLKRFGFLSEIANEQEFSNLRWWLLSTRGHYTDYVYEFEELDYLLEIMDLANPSDSFQGVAIHFRLGDLTHLQSKSFIPIKRIRNALLLTTKSDNLRIYSDSNPEICSGIWGEDIERRISFRSESPIATIRSCVLSEDFVGTNSKISIIVALCRLRLKRSGSTLLPYEIIHQARTNAANVKETLKVHYY